MDISYKRFEIVLAKLGGYPWWPCFIREQLGGRKCEVVFLEDYTRSTVSISKIKKY